MGIYDTYVLPRLIHLACGSKDIATHRAELLQDASGRVLDIGFGSGINLPHYPKAVRELLVVEPSTTALAMAQSAIKKVGFPVTFAGSDGQQLSLATNSVDTVVITFALCTIPRIDQVLNEVHRVLKPGGKLLFLEHGLSQETRTARWQNRINFLQMALCGGCHLNRPMDSILKMSPLKLHQIKTFYLPHIPKTHGFIYQGQALKT